MTPASAALALAPELVVEWRQRAACYRADNVEPAATIYTRVADELERAIATAADETLTLAEAALESGMHPDTLRHLVAAGKLANAGRRGAPRIRRGDLPRKHGGVGQGSQASAPGGYDVDADARSLAGKLRLG